MKIISFNTTSQLFVKAQALREQHNSWRCIYLNLADKRGVYSQQLLKHFFIRPIAKMLEGHEGAIYLCEDGDIVILFQGALESVLDKFVAQFGDLESEHASATQQSKLFNFLDLSVDFRAFYVLVYAKAHRKQVAAQDLFATSYARYKARIAPQVAG